MEIELERDTPYPYLAGSPAAAAAPGEQGLPPVRTGEQGLPTGPDRSARAGRAGRGTRTYAYRKSRRAAAAEPLSGYRAHRRNRRRRRRATRKAPAGPAGAAAGRGHAPAPWSATRRSAPPPRRAAPDQAPVSSGRADPAGEPVRSQRRQHRHRRNTHRRRRAATWTGRAGMRGAPPSSRGARRRIRRPFPAAAPAPAGEPVRSQRRQHRHRRNSPPPAPRRDLDRTGQETQTPQLPARRPDDGAPPARRRPGPPADAPADRVQAMARWLRDADAASAAAEATTRPSMDPQLAPPPPGRVPGRPGPAEVHPEVTVTIGRIEVKASAADPVPARPPSSGPRRRAPSLDDYLESRTRARRRPG